MPLTHLYVPDASVILKWVFDTPDEADREPALNLLAQWTQGACDIVLPSLWIYEVGNIVGRNIPGKAAQIISLLLEYRFDEAQVTDPLAARALAIMSQSGATFYDAAYHAVALEFQGTLVTADAAYVRKARKWGHVLLLSDVNSK